MNNTGIDSILNGNSFRGSMGYFWNDGWKMALPYEYIIYTIIVGTMLKVLFQYLLWKYMKSTANSLLWIPSSLLTLPSFLLLYSFFSDKPFFIYIIIPLIITMAIVICENYLQKGMKEFNWIRTDIV